MIYKCQCTHIHCFLNRFLSYHADFLISNDRACILLKFILFPPVIAVIFLIMSFFINVATGSRLVDFPFKTFVRLINCNFLSRLLGVRLNNEYIYSFSRQIVLEDKQ